MKIGGHGIDVLFLLTGIGTLRLEIPMATDIAKQARREADRLEQELTKNPLFRKWKLQVSVAEEYEADSVAAEAAPPASEPKAVAVSVQKAVQPPSVSEKVQQAGIAFLRQHGKRAKAKEIYEAIRGQGLPIKGGDPIATVAAHMSNAKKYVNNVRGEGYGLIEWPITMNGAEFMQRLNASLTKQ